jgi:phosphatidate phosphatase PAH1
VKINDEDSDLLMKLGSAGEAFFVEKTEAPADVPLHMLVRFSTILVHFLFTCSAVVVVVVVVYQYVY